MSIQRGLVIFHPLPFANSLAIFKTHWLLSCVVYLCSLALSFSSRLGVPAFFVVPYVPTLPIVSFGDLGIELIFTFCGRLDTIFTLEEFGEPVTTYIGVRLPNATRQSRLAAPAIHSCSVSHDVRNANTKTLRDCAHRFPLHTLLI